MPIEPDRLYHDLGYLIAQMPNMGTHQWQTADGQRWLGRASALLEQSGPPIDAVSFNLAAERLSSNVFIPGHP